MTGTVFDIQRFSLFDGPGIRTVVFLKGCPLNCIWCHNPEGLSEEPEIMFDSRKCIGCLDCVKVCKSGGHSISDGKHLFLKDRCSVCLKCTDICPADAVFPAGRKMSVEEVMDSVKRDMPLYKESGGGITLSGGEPLFQADFAIGILARAKESGLHTCIETCGYAPSESLCKVAEYTDVICYDYKVTGDEDHIKYCGVPQGLIIKNLSLLDKIGKTIILRCPIIPGINDTDEHINGICDIACRFKSISEIHLEPYHSVGISKFRMLQISPQFEGEPPTHQKLTEYCNIITNTCQKKCSII